MFALAGNIQIGLSDRTVFTSWIGFSAIPSGLIGNAMMFINLNLSTIMDLSG